jgi:hypothetical protein
MRSGTDIQRGEYGKVQFFPMDLFKEAAEKIGQTRAEELRQDIVQLENDLRKLRSMPVELEDEP